MESSTKCYKTFKELPPSVTPAWWRMGRKDEKRGRQKRTNSTEDQLQGSALVAITLVIAVLVTVFVSMLVVAITTILVFRAAHAKRLLDGHLLSA